MPTDGPVNTSALLINQRAHRWFCQYISSPHQPMCPQMVLSIHQLSSSTNMPTDGSVNTSALLINQHAHRWFCQYISSPHQPMCPQTVVLSLHQLPPSNNVSAEILAICTAAEHLLQSMKKMGNIAIFTDSLSTLQALNSADPIQMIQGLHSSLVKMTAQFTVSLQWVPAHVGLTGNEKADRLAKIGSQAPKTQNPTPTVTYREAKTLLHSRYNGDWKEYNGKYQAHLDPIWRLERAQQTTIFRLLTEHCGLSAHLKRDGISDTSFCECGQADQTPDHVL